MGELYYGHGVSPFCLFIRTSGTNKHQSNKKLPTSKAKNAAANKISKSSGIKKKKQNEVAVPTKGQAAAQNTEFEESSEEVTEQAELLSDNSDLTADEVSDASGCYVWCMLLCAIKIVLIANILVSVYNRDRRPGLT